MKELLPFFPTATEGVETPSYRRRSCRKWLISSQPLCLRPRSPFHTKSTSPHVSKQKNDKDYAVDSSVVRKEIEKMAVNREEKVDGQHRFLLDNQSGTVPNSSAFNDHSEAKSPDLPLNDVAFPPKYLLPTALAFSIHLPQKLQSTLNGQQSGPTTPPGFWYSDHLITDEIHEPLCSQGMKANSPNSPRKATPLALKRPHVFKPFKKFYVRRKNSFLHQWSAFTNADLLEENCASLLAPDTHPIKSARSHSSSFNFNQSLINIQGANASFLRGTLNQDDIRTKSDQSDAEVESVVSASSDELEHCDTEELQASSAISGSYGKDIAKLFQSDSPQLKNKVDASWFSSTNNQAVPKSLLSIMEACDITIS